MANEYDTLPRKKYKLWEENRNVSIPIRNRQRWDRKIALSIPVIDGSDNDTNQQNFTQVSNTSHADDHLSSKSYSDDIYIDEVYDYEIYEFNDFVNDNNQDYEDDTTMLDDINYNVVDICESLYDHNEHSTDFNESIFCTSHSNVNNNTVLFNNSAQTVDETVYNLINLYIKHRMTKFNLEDMLTVINNMLSQLNLMPKTLYKLFSYVKNMVPPFTVIKHVYCKKCMLYKSVKAASKVCKLCLISEIFFFLRLI
ncbi:uncharacterized protein LOC105839407 [Monomorium pharaonis]|uniref:uncharacterized protein LOC105839407 n=1 Tax=Monomorium pharaonis TaxID=307658 RepID=UPI00174788C7|nr:uncharacterized protein LOC105839407 [Monomorium pharaonis]